MAAVIDRVYLTGMGRQLFALVRSLAVGTVFLSIWTWFVPRWIAREPLHAQPGIPPVMLMSIGAVIIFRCFFDFAWRGHGTPAPFDAPRHLVVSGLYRWVRNPMYTGLGVLLAGEALLLPQITREMLVMTAILWAAFTVFILLYEEPALRRLFGAEYEEYCRYVHRWLPRLTPFDNQTKAAVH